MAWPIKTGDFPWIFTSHLDVRGTKVMIHGHIWPIYVCIQLYMYIVYIYWLYVYIIYIYRKWYCVFFFHVDQSQLHQATLLDTPRTGTTCKPSPAQIKWWRCDRAMGHGSGDLLFWGCIHVPSHQSGQIITTSLRPSPVESWLIREIIPKWP